MHARPALALAVSFVLGFALAARADDKKDDTKVKKTGAEEEEAEKSDFPPYERVTKDYAATEGFWDLLYRTKDQGLLALIPTAELERPFLFTTSLSGGAPQAGWQLTSDLVAWERLNKKLVLVQKNVWFRADPERPIADAVVRTYSDRVILSTPILAESPKGLVIDLKEILVGHARDFLGMGIDGSLAKVTKRKTFPTNVECAFSAPLYGDGTLLLWHYSFRKLPNPGDFKPRVADDRIGYFLTAIKDYTKGDPGENRFVRLVNRWDLQKAQPELPLSPPKTPITFYIEKTVPFRYRRWVEAGILEWNKAFEKCGFSGAIVVRQQTADNEFKDFDPEDARYNFFRWVVNDEGYAMGPSRTDPRTGQILDADIIFDDSMVEYYATDYETLLKEGPKVYMKRNASPAAAETRVAVERLAHALEPLGFKVDADRVTSVLAGAPVVSGPARTRAELQAKLEQYRPQGCCEIGEGFRHELALGGAMKLLLEEDGSRAKNAPDDFLGDCVKHIVMHEVGHTLGLRHNFKGSSWRTLDEINSAERPGDVSASVMDYCPINVAPEGRPQGHYMNSTIGPYDLWAIEYGYKVGQEKPELDPAELAAIASRANEPGHAFGTDGDLGNADPLCALWDLGSDPMAFAKARLDFAKRVRDKLMSRAVKVGESWEKLRRAFEMVLFEQARAGYYAARLVGSAEIHRNHKGDPGERPPLEIVPAARQREALRFACEQVFDDKNYLVTPELLDHLGFARWDHWGSSEPEAQYPIHERVLQAQRYTLSVLMSEGLLRRLLDDQVKAAPGDDPVTIEELFSTLEGAIFKELDGKGLVSGTNGHPQAISSFRQNLQDFYVRRLTELTLEQQVPALDPVVAATGKKVAAAHLEKLSKRCLDGASAQLDETSKAHLVAIGRHAEQAKNAQYVHLASGAGCSLAPLGAAPAALAPLGLALFVLIIRRRRS